MNNRRDPAREAALQRAAEKALRRIALGVGIILVTIVVAMLAGCFATLRGAAAPALGSHRDGTRTQPAVAAAAAGVGVGDERQFGGVYVGIENEAMASDAAAVAPIVALGGRYERAVSDARPSVRAYVRGDYGWNACQGKQADGHDSQASCAGPNEGRGITMITAGAGVAWSAGSVREGHVVGFWATAALGFSYAHVDDSMLGANDFFGIEATIGIGGDLAHAGGHRSTGEPR
jgi:hypothetical protein